MKSKDFRFLFSVRLKIEAEKLNETYAARTQKNTSPLTRKSAFKMIKPSPTAWMEAKYNKWKWTKNKNAENEVRIPTTDEEETNI